MAAGANPTYVVPSGKVAVIRSALFVNSSPGVASASLIINGAWVMWYASNIAVNGTAQLETRQVLNAGDAIVAAANAGNMDLTLSGYLLQAMP